MIEAVDSSVTILFIDFPKTCIDRQINKHVRNINFQHVVVIPHVVVVMIGKGLECLEEKVIWQKCLTLHALPYGYGTYCRTCKATCNARSACVPTSICR